MSVINTRKLHPIARINYIPRMIACSFYLLIVGSVIGFELFSFEYVWIFVLGLVWPHIALYLSYLAGRGVRRQEEVNMHLDVMLTMCVLSAVPVFNLLCTATIITIANGLFIGSFRLFATTLLLYIVCLMLSCLILEPVFIEIGMITDIAIFSFFGVYFGSFALLGHNLTKRLIRLNKEVKSLSIRDSLTKSYNRLYLDRALLNELERCYRVRYPLSLIFADLDHFKTINDKYGHTVGDDILKQFVKIVQANIREDTDWVARYGGEEFVIVLPNLSLEDSVLTAERIRQKVDERLFLSGDTSLHATCSFGVASIDPLDDRVSPETLLARADEGLYRAKNQGRNRVAVTDENKHVE